MESGGKSEESLPRANPPRYGPPHEAGVRGQGALSATHMRQHGPSRCADPRAWHYLGWALKQGVLTGSKWSAEQRKTLSVETPESQRTVLIRELQWVTKGAPTQSSGQPEEKNRTSICGLSKNKKHKSSLKFTHRVALIPSIGPSIRCCVPCRLCEGKSAH